MHYLVHKPSCHRPSYVPCRFSLTLNNLIHQYSSISLAMSLLLAVADLRLIFKYNDLLSLGLPHRSSHNLSPLDNWVPYKGIPIPPNKQYFIKLDCVAFGDIQALHFYRLLRGYLVLLATYFNNSVNLLTPVQKRGF